MSVRTGRLGIYLPSNGLRPDRRAAPPGVSRYRFSFDPPPPLEKCTTGCFALPRLQTHQRRFALLGEGTESLATNADGGHRGRGRGFGRRKFGDSLFSYLFLFLL